MKLNNNLQQTESIQANQTYVPGVQFDTEYEVQSRQLKASRMAIGTTLNRTYRSVGTADFSLGSVLTFSSEAQFDVPYQTKRVLGNAYVALYQGTVINGSTQIFPVRGGSVTGGRYQVQGWYDYHGWDGTTNVWRGQITDTTGTSTGVVSVYVDWLYVDYTLGTIT